MAPAAEATVVLRGAFDAARAAAAATAAAGDGGEGGGGGAMLSSVAPPSLKRIKAAAEAALLVDASAHGRLVSVRAFPSHPRPGTATLRFAGGDAAARCVSRLTGRAWRPSPAALARAAAALSSSSSSSSITSSSSDPHASVSSLLSWLGGSELDADIWDGVESFEETAKVGRKAGKGAGAAGEREETEEEEERRLEAFARSLEGE